ncbi:DUF4167 domain-containing protein [Ponticaulis profundi]|uniref:DUF4167 domain-containing protein n=1 Tax=Ponticaulis profundi TaxID=2665222 RepID=A0ABW1SCL3_9PROT
MKRQRGRGRKPSNPGNRSYESNGPDVKIRGNANQIYDKYLQYARDAQTAGDRIAAEAFYQHAEHYFRIMAMYQPKDRPPQNQDDSQESRNESDNDDDDDSRDNDEETSSRNHEKSKSSSKSSDDVQVDGLQVVDGEGEGPDEIAASSNSKSSAPRRRRSPRRSTKSENSDNGSSDGEAASKEEPADDAGLKAVLARSAAPADDAGDQKKEGSKEAVESAEG